MIAASTFRGGGELRRSVNDLTTPIMLRMIQDVIIHKKHGRGVGTGVANVLNFCTSEAAFHISCGWIHPRRKEMSSDRASSGNGNPATPRRSLSPHSINTFGRSVAL